MEGCFLEEELVVARADAARLAQQLADRSSGDTAVRGLLRIVPARRLSCSSAGPMLDNPTGSCRRPQNDAGHPVLGCSAGLGVVECGQDLNAPAPMLMDAECCRQDEAKRAEDTARLWEELQQAVQDASDVQEMLQEADARQSADAVRFMRLPEGSTAVLLRPVYWYARHWYSRCWVDTLWLLLHCFAM